MKSGGIVHEDDLPIKAQPKLQGNNQQGSRGYPREGASDTTPPNSESPPELLPLEGQIDAAIAQAIAACGGSIAKAAEALKIAPSTVYRRGILKTDVRD